MGLDIAGVSKGIVLHLEATPKKVGVKTFIAKAAQVFWTGCRFLKKRLEELTAAIVLRRLEEHRPVAKTCAMVAHEVPRDNTLRPCRFSHKTGAPILNGPPKSSNLTNGDVNLPLP